MIRRNTDGISTEYNDGIGVKFRPSFDGTRTDYRRIFGKLSTEYGPNIDDFSTEYLTDFTSRTGNGEVGGGGRGRLALI